MVFLKLALRNLARRKARAITIGLLVIFGTFLLVFGGIFTQSAKIASQKAIIEHFTGDLVLYAKESKSIPSPFSFGSILPSVNNSKDVLNYLSKDASVANFTGIAQNVANISVVRDGVKTDFSFLFYAVEPESYLATFENVQVTKGQYFPTKTPGGIMMSNFQAKNIKEKYGIELIPGEEITLLSLTSSGSVNAQKATFFGTYDPKHYSNVFNYIGTMDIDTYSKLYNFTGVKSESLPGSVNDALKAVGDDDIFSLSGDAIDTINTDTLQDKELSGYTMIQVKLKDHTELEAFKTRLAAQNFDISMAPWDKASDFFAIIADIIQFVILFITAIIFLIVALILSNTLIINIIERTTEIGTLRALGAEQGFIRSLFMLETLALNTFFAFIGALLAVIVTLSTGNTGIALPDIASQYLVGGGNLVLTLSPFPIILGFGVVILVSLLATWGPTQTASRVSPLKAMSSI